MSISLVNREQFFDKIRISQFGGSLSETQVGGMTAILDAWEKWNPANSDLNPNQRWLAYMFATAYREAGANMIPVREIGEGRNKPYGTTYYGRGLVQLTWQSNYEELGTALGINLVGNPDLALQPDIAAQIMLQGMSTGRFTGKRLSQYFGAVEAHDNPVGARAIINGNNVATLVAGYYAHFKFALAA